MLLRVARSKITPGTSPGILALWAGLSGLVLVTAGCRSLPEFPPVDLTHASWQTREAQVLWEPKTGAPPLVCELLVGLQPGGLTYVQLTKNPFPLMVARTTPQGWELTIPPQDKRYSGPGMPPARVGLFQVARALSGQPLAQGWTWSEPEPGTFSLVRPSTGERLSGHWQ